MFAAPTSKHKVSHDNHSNKKLERDRCHRVLVSIERTGERRSPPVRRREFVSLLASILDLCSLFCLPLHIRRDVGTTAFQWDDVIDDVTTAWSASLSGRRTGLLLLKFMPRAGTTCDFVV